MSDVSKFGPLGEGEESRPLKVDLTRIDIRRGTLNLPRRFYDAFEAGEIEANDTSLGKELKVTFVPPRELEGLGPFFEEHDLQPNDAVTIAFAGGLQLTPIKRERRRSDEPSRAHSVSRNVPNDEYQDERPAEGGYVREVRNGLREERAPEAQAPFGGVREKEPQQSREPERRREGAPDDGRVRERVRLEAQQLGRDTVHKPASEEKPAGREVTRVRLEAQEPAAYLAPPVPETKGGWQDVLHDPAPRRGQMLRPSERAVVHPDDLPVKGGAGERRVGGAPASESKQQGLFREEVGQFGKVREAPHQEGRKPRGGPIGSEPLAPKQEADREQSTPARGSRDSAPADGAGDRERRRLAPESSASPSPRAERPAAPEPEKAREPVLVGGSQAEGDLTGRISRYLQDPKTPAIVRASSVAEDLRLPLEAVQQGLAEVSRKSDGSVASIRPDVYLVKRSR